MTIAIKHITFDALDPQALAMFWTGVTGLEVKNDWGEFVILERNHHLPHLAFYKTDEGKTVKDRIHLDLKVDDLATETKRLTGLGATVISKHETEHLNWNVLADPEGNEFCIAADW